MKFFLGLLFGLFLTVCIAAGGAYFAFGNITDIGERDKTKDITETFDLTGFEGIEVAGVYELDVQVGKDYSVVLSGNPDDMGRVNVSVEDGELVLGQDRIKFGKRRHHHGGITAVVSLPVLSEIGISGIIDGEVSGIDAVNFKADFSGVGSVDLAGVCGHLDADISGIGDFDARELRCKTADVSVSGIGNASIFARDEIETSVSGIGSVSIYGSPSKVRKDSGLLSDISVK